MASKKKLLQAAAGSAGGGGGLDVDDVYSTFVYTGSNADNNSIVNNIDLSGEGGLVWVKQRGGNQDHQLFDTERGVTKFLESNSNNQQDTNSETLTTFNSDGFILNDAASVNSSEDFTSWTFRKAPKFLDIVTYTGDGTTTKTVSHNLGSTPGMILYKRTDSSGNWLAHHANMINNFGYTQPYLRLNSDSADLGDYGNNLTPTSSVIRTPVHSNSGNTADSINVNGATYVAYVFAHNNNDGGFGPDSDQDIIKCGIYTGNGSHSGNPINIGFEPQWVMIKRADASDHWIIFDSIRGMPETSASDASFLLASDNVGEDANFALAATSSGFSPSGTESKVNASGSEYIYMAIRRGPLAAPTSASQVFNTNPAVGASGNLGQHRSGFPVDFALQKVTNTFSNWEAGARLIQNKSLRPNDTNAEATSSGFKFDYMDGWGTGSADSNRASWMWRRAPNFCDVVTYTGNGTAGRTVNHNLGVVPEMIWIKSRNNSVGWVVWDAYSDIASKTYGLMSLDQSSHDYVNYSALNSTTPTSTQIILGNHQFSNYSNYTYIAFLFATVAGVSKVGSYTGNGSTQTIDCGFSNGSKLVIIKNTDSDNTNWLLMDSVRGIVAGNDPSLSINNTANIEEVDLINPQSSGFEVEEHSGSTNHRTNTNGESYIFYAIAA